jgi:hypothetical protein
MPTIDPTPRKRPPRPNYKAKLAKEKAITFTWIFAGWCVLAVGVGMYFGGHHIMIMALMPVLMIVMLILAQVRSKPS